MKVAAKSDKKNLFIAIMPIFAGIQQIAEGLVWNGLDSNNPEFTYLGAMTYLFFVWILWPSWSPLMSAITESNSKKKKIFFMCSGAGLLLGGYLYLPYYILPMEEALPLIAKHSIDYCAPPALRQLPFDSDLIYALYLALIAGPPLFSSCHYLKIFGGLLTLAVPITFLVAIHAKTSVMCFLAAGITIYLIYALVKDGFMSGRRIILLPRN